MKNLLQYLPLFFFALLANMGFAQVEDEEITESSEPIENFYIDDVVERRMISDSRVLPYEPIREADIAWQKRIWRVIDVREKMNSGFRYYEKPFFSILKEHLEYGDIKAFADEGFKEELLPSDIEARLNRIDTISFFNDETYEEEIKIVPNEINPDDVRRYRLKEIWFFDEESSTLRNRIIAIAPTKDVIDLETGVFKYEEVLFWVYYPEAREFLSKHMVYNDFNDMSPMTWYDLFESRFFSSYIIRESNSLGARLKDLYEDEVDQLLESEKIKAELFNFEHDLWEY